jgi:hypothetical protein
MKLLYITPNQIFTKFSKIVAVFYLVDRIQVVEITNNTEFEFSKQMSVKIFGLNNNLVSMLFSTNDFKKSNFQIGEIQLFKAISYYAIKFVDYKTYLAEIFISAKCFILDDFEKVTINYEYSDYEGKFMHINDSQAIYYPYSNKLFYRVKGLNYKDNSIKIIPNKINTIASPFDSIVNDEGGSIRFTPIENKNAIMVPHSGAIISISYVKGSTVFKFVNKFIMPDQIGERDLASVHNGNYTYSGVGVGMGNRNYPEKIKPQPSTNLYYSMVVEKIIDENDIVVKDFYYQGDILIKNGNLVITTVTVDYPWFYRAFPNKLYIIAGDMATKLLY